jgi:putative ABC transport system permease protein
LWNGLQIREKTMRYHRGMLERWWQDVRQAVTALSRARGFSTVAIATLALGIAGVTVMFTLVEGVLLRRWPVQDQSRLIVAWKRLPASGFDHYPFGDLEIEEVARSSRLLESAAGMTRAGVSRWVALENGESSYVNGAVVTGAFFDVLGARAAIGRALTIDDDVSGAEPVVVISNGLWQRRYGSTRDILGRRLQIDERAFTIVGVMPPGIDYPRRVDVWRPSRTIPTDGPFGDAPRREIDLIARLRSGVTLEQLTSELTSLTLQFESEGRRDVPKGLTPIVRTFDDTTVGDMRKPILVLFGAVGLVLIIASANVANLLLMRAESRRRELAVRAALGASQSRIVRQMLMESGVLATVASAIGLALTLAALRPLIRLVPAELPRPEWIQVDLTVVLFTVLVAFAASLLAGVLPAVSSARADLMAQLRGGGRGLTTAANRFSRRALVVSQVALAVMILVTAGLLTQSLSRLQSVDLGLSGETLVFAELALPQGRYADQTKRAQFLDQSIGRLEHESAITAVTPLNVPPFAGIGGWDVPHFAAEGQDASRVEANSALNLESVFPGYFRTLGITLQRGRAFMMADRRDGLRVAIVSDDVARVTWPAQDPIGKRLKMGGINSRDPWWTVVGVAMPTRYRDLTTPRPTLYVPAAQFQMTAGMLALRTTASLDEVARLTRATVQNIDPAVHVMRVQPFSRMLDSPLAGRRFSMRLAAIFALIALTLAAVGLYAVMAASVRQRDREIGIRVALGASSNTVRRLVFGEGLRLVGIGAAIGAAGAVAGARLMQSLLFETAALNPAAIVAAVLVLVTACAVACYIPVRRATRIDPVSLLNAE